MTAGTYTVVACAEGIEGERNRATRTKQKKVENLTLLGMRFKEVTESPHI
jgi:hypothetical protein